MFTRIYDEQRKIFDDTRLAIKETIHICKDEDILGTYIEKYEREAVDTMLTMYDPEEELREYIRCEVAEGVAKGVAKGEAKGFAEGESRGQAKAITMLMKKMNISKEEAMDMLEITGEDAEKIAKFIEN